MGAAGVVEEWGKLIYVYLCVLWRILRLEKFAFHLALVIALFVDFAPR